MVIDDDSVWRWFKGVGAGEGDARSKVDIPADKDGCLALLLGKVAARRCVGLRGEEPEIADADAGVPARDGALWATMSARKARDANLALGCAYIDVSYFETPPASSHAKFRG